MENIYVTAMKNGKQVRVKYRNKCEDYSGGWWSEEFWMYDPETNRLRYYYPDSNFEKGFFTLHDEDAANCIMTETVRLATGGYKDESVDVEDIIIEDAGIPVSSRSIVEKAIEKIKTMTDEEIIRRVFSGVVS